MTRRLAPAAVRLAVVPVTPPVIAPVIALAIALANVPAPRADAAPAGPGGGLTVVSVTPTGQTAPVAAGVSITFDQPVDRDTIGAASVWAFGKSTGMATGGFSYADGDRTVTLTPDDPFAHGEAVVVFVSHDVAAASGPPMRAAGYSWQFLTRAMPADIDFALIDDHTTNEDGESSQPYGGIGADLNNDGWLDLGIVNEVTEDFRVFLNQGDGTGAVDPFMTPTAPLNAFASPSDAADFDRDGNIDVCVSNQGSNSVSVLMGNGDGTFTPRSEIAVGGVPNGIATLDADGDGDMDFVNCNPATSNLCLHLNDGAGGFAAPVFFDAGVVSKRALAAADMNEDGIMDLVVGSRSSPTSHVVVMTGNGDGTFTAATPRAYPGTIWMLVTGDVNGDGHVDASVVSGAFNNQNEGSFLLGDGAGGVGAPQDYPIETWPVATDLGDLDGDGDLDWVASSYGGDWQVYLNDGTGQFAFEREFDAPSAASCALLLDLDNDRDLDIAAIDETADVLMTWRNSGRTELGDVNGDGAVDFSDLLQLLAAWGDCGACPEDLNGDGNVGFQDLVLMLARWS